MSIIKEHFDLEEEIKKIMVEKNIVVECYCGEKSGLVIFEERRIYAIVTSELKRIHGKNIDFDECHSIIKKLIDENYSSDECEYCGYKFK